MPDNDLRQYLLSGIVADGQRDRGRRGRRAAGCVARTAQPHRLGLHRFVARERPRLLRRADMAEVPISGIY
mgnify:CR=1 FL=1